MAISEADVTIAIDALESVLNEGLVLLGAGAFVPLAQRVEALGARMVLAAASPTPALAVEVVAADAAAEAAVDAKFPPK